VAAAVRRDKEIDFGVLLDAVRQQLLYFLPQLVTATRVKMRG
jgi:hypothetical protein